MLKLHYTEVGLYMEQTMTNPELWLAQRVVLALRLGQPLHLEPGRASFLLPADLPAPEQLERELQRELSLVITLIPVDDELVEVSLSGTWVAESSEAHEGLFLTVMSARSEFLLYRLWQRSQAHLAALTSPVSPM